MDRTNSAKVQKVIIAASAGTTCLQRMTEHVYMHVALMDQTEI